MSGEGGAEFSEGPDLFFARDPGDNVAGEAAPQGRLPGIQTETVYQCPHDGREGVAVVVGKGRHAVTAPAKIGQLEKIHRQEARRFPQLPGRFMAVGGRAVMRMLRLAELPVLPHDKLPWNL